MSDGRCRGAWTLLVSCPLLVVVTLAAPPDGRIDPNGIAGKLVIVGGGTPPASVIDRFVELAGGAEARLVVIPTASQSAVEPDPEPFLRPWRDYGLKSMQVLHTRSREQADDPLFVQPLRTATAVWFDGGQQSRIADAYVGTAVERELYELLRRGGVLGGTSAGAAVQSKLMIARGNPVAVTAIGLDLLPGAVVDQHFRQRNRQPRLLRVLEEHPGHFGIGVDEETAIIVEGRQIQTLGENVVTICLAASETRPARQLELRHGDVADLTALRRAARDRAGPDFPPTHPTPVQVEHGALLLGGGGRLPGQVIRKFIDLAGGSDSLIVVLPTANPDAADDRNGEAEMFRRAGASNVVVLPQRNLSEVEDAGFAKVLNNAGGLWFGGGRQWRFVDAYEQTNALRLFHEVLRRGGVIGGSSAGASIQAEYLVRGNPLGNRDIMSEGYERGFAFLPGTAVDQHFTQRKRRDDMVALLEAFPQLLGIGIDESTALLVQGHCATVLGRNQVHFFDRSQESAAHVASLSAEERFDLLLRRPFADAHP